MTIFIILLCLLILGITITYKSYNFDILGVIIALIFGMYLLIHTYGWLRAEYSFNQWVLQRQSFVETLNEVRKSGRELENTTISKDIIQWNKELAESKYDNSTLLFGDYIDDRVVNLKPIK